MKRDWLPHPPAEYLLRICGAERVSEPLKRAFDEDAERELAALKEAGLVREGMRVLEAECCPGRMARWLVDEPISSYLGFDSRVHELQWCQQEISRRDDRFVFEHFEPGDGPAPWPDASFDLILIGKIMTRVPPEKVPMFLAELSRLAAPGGCVVLAVYFGINADTAIPDGTFLVNPKPFYDTLQGLGFAYKLRGPERTGRIHNWFHLTKPREDRSES